MSQKTAPPTSINKVVEEYALPFTGGDQEHWRQREGEGYEEYKDRIDQAYMALAEGAWNKLGRPSDVTKEDIKIGIIRAAHNAVDYLPM